jgi:hypothetical protein
MLKEADMKNKSKTVELQMSKAKDDAASTEEDFLSQLNGALRSGS